METDRLPILFRQHLLKTHQNSLLIHIITPMIQNTQFSHMVSATRTVTRQHILPKYSRISSKTNPLRITRECASDYGALTKLIRARARAGSFPSHLGHLAGKMRLSSVSVTIIIVTAKAVAAISAVKITLSPSIEPSR